MTKQLQNIEPFIIKNDKLICGMSSVLQCLLSLPNFLNSLNSQTKSPILNYFSKFMEEPHNTQNIKQFIETNYGKINFKDSFEFLNSFIDLIKKKQEPDNMFHGKVSEINECALCDISSGKDHFFSSIELSFTQSLRILYIPYDLDDDPILMAQIPNIKKNIVLMHQKNDEYFIIDDDKISPKYSNIVAFELPDNNKNNVIAIIQLNFQSDEVISSPFLCEIPISQKNDKKNLQLIISKRIQNLFKSKNITIEIYGMVSKSVKYNQYNICLNPLKVTVTKYSKISNKREPQQEDEICVSLKEMFDSYISRSKLNVERKCEYCDKSNIPYFRKRLINLPQILIFRIKKSENKNSNQLIIPEFIYLDTGEYNAMDVMGNPNEYQNDKNIQKYELRAVSHSYKSAYNSLKYFSDVKRGSQWHRIKEDKIASGGYRLKDPINTADLLFYEIISNGSNNDDFKNRVQSPSGKIKIRYILDDTEKTLIASFDRNQYKKASDFIKYFRYKYPNKEINGFNFAGKDYYLGDDTSFNEIFPLEISDIPIIKIIAGKPVSKPSGKPSIPSRYPIKKPDVLDGPSINISYSVIDNSSSMIGCFKDSGERRSKVSIEIIKRFLRAGQLYCSSDSFKFYRIFMSHDVNKPEYNPENFNEPSELPDLLESITDVIIKSKNYKNKRIFLISDGVVILDEESGDKEQLMETYRKIIDNQIILDVVLLKSGTQISKELCAVSHMSGGYHFCPQNLNELYEFIENESFIDLRKRQTINNAFQNYFNEKGFENISKNILSIPNSYKDNKFYPVLVNASPLSEFNIKDDIKIEKEVYNCVYMQQKKKYFKIYRVINQYEEIEKRRVSVFLKSKQGVVLQFDIFFPLEYPTEAPWFKLVSNVEMKNEVIPNCFFRVQEDEYSKKTKLIDLIDGLNELLQSENVEKDLKNVESPIKSLNQIESLFYTKFGSEEKDLDAYKDED